VGYRERAAHAARVILEGLPAGAGGVVLVAGESGSGKSVVAGALARRASAAGELARIIAQDDYFHLPPAENHARRLADLEWVGPGEVDLARLAAHVIELRAGEPEALLIVEGTYVLRLPLEGTRVFIDVTHEETLAGRLARGRDAIDAEWTPRILAREQPFIRADRPRADVVLDAQWGLKSASAKPGGA
jgi:hypothetical protein